MDAGIFGTYNLTPATHDPIPEGYFPHSQATACIYPS